MINVGFIFTEGLITWNGGINYYRNLITILKNTDKYVPFIFCSYKMKELIEKRFSDTNVIYCKFLTSGTIESKIKNFGFLIGYIPFINKILKKNKINIVSHNSLFPMNQYSSVKNLMWIPDFQQQYLPEYFSKSIKKRQVYLNNLCIKRATKIVVSSFDAKEDLLKFYPKSAQKEIEVLQFALLPRENTEIDSKILNKYDVDPFSYFLVTNQFWRHKNHKVILEALSLLKKQNKLGNIKIIATGLMRDPRDDEYIIQLKDHIQKEQLESIFVNVGNIPYIDVLVLQHFCIALIQPSKFEGWNTSVEECKQIGKKIILSNLKVHKEQNPENVKYFNNQNADNLADILYEVNKNFSLQEEEKFYTTAQQLQVVKWNEFQNRYVNILEKL